LFRADTLSSGTDVTIAATGIMLKEAMDTAALLLKEGISAEVLNIHTIKPIDQKHFWLRQRKQDAS
jgi:transketolase